MVFASKILLTLMERFPVIITLGAALLGWVAGDMAVTDPVDKPWVDLNAAFLHWGAPLACSIAVVVVGKWLAARRIAARTVEPTAGPAAAEPAAVGALRRVLLAVDGSEQAARAVRRVLALRDELRDGGQLQVHLINVQRPVSGDVARFVPGQTLEDYHRERGEKALEPARALFAAAGVPHEDHLRVGDPGETIAATALDTASDLIVMGARGLGTHTAAMIGSVAQSTIERAGVPVLVVK